MKSAHSRSTSARAMSRRRRAKRNTRARMLQALLQERNVSDNSEKKTTNSSVALCRRLRVFERSGSNGLGYEKCLYAPPREGAASCGDPEFSLAGKRVAEHVWARKRRTEYEITRWCLFGAKDFAYGSAEKTTCWRYLESKSSVLITRPARVTRGLL